MWNPVHKQNTIMVMFHRVQYIKKCALNSYDEVQQ